MCVADSPVSVTKNVTTLPGMIVLSTGLTGQLFQSIRTAPAAWALDAPAHASRMPVATRRRTDVTSISRQDQDLAALALAADGHAIEVDARRRDGAVVARPVPHHVARARDCEAAV